MCKLFAITGGVGRLIVGNKVNNKLSIFKRYFIRTLRGISLIYLQFRVFYCPRSSHTLKSSLACIIVLMSHCLNTQFIPTVGVLCLSKNYVPKDSKTSPISVGVTILLPLYERNERKYHLAQVECSVVKQQTRYFRFLE